MLCVTLSLIFIVPIFIYYLNGRVLVCTIQSDGFVKFSQFVSKTTVSFGTRLHGTGCMQSEPFFGIYVQVRMRVVLVSSFFNRLDRNMGLLVTEQIPAHPNPVFAFS